MTAQDVSQSFWNIFLIVVILLSLASLPFSLCILLIPNTIFLFHPMGFRHLYSIIHNVNGTIESCSRKSLLLRCGCRWIYLSYGNFSLIYHLLLFEPKFNFSFGSVGAFDVSTWIQSFCSGFCNRWANLIRPCVSRWIALIMLFNFIVILLRFLLFSWKLDCCSLQILHSR